MIRVAYIGNFAHPHCTEVAVAYALEQLGCTVDRLQQDWAHENGPNWFLRRYNVDGLPDLVLYTRTHNATALRDDRWSNVWQRLPSASLHLDRFWDLDREALIHDHDPLFTTQHVFTADGGNQDRFAAADVNHHWLPPAIDVRECHHDVDIDPSVPPVVFIGTGGRNYHREYPQRHELLRFLTRRYRGRFGHFGLGGRTNVRGVELAQVVRSARVVVGDSCFANQSPALARDYWSDRIPETLGRAGALVHPYVEGIDEGSYLPGIHLLTHAPGNWEQLAYQVDYLLDSGTIGAQMGSDGRARVLNGHTYTHRAAELLHTVGLRDTADVDVPA